MRDYKQNDAYARKVISLCVIGAILLLALLAFLQLYSEFPAHPIGSTNEGKGRTTGAMILFGALCVVWAVSVNVRCSDAVVRRYLMIIASLLAGWMIVVLVKYSSSNDIFISILWYIFYIPMILAPTLFLFCIVRVSSLEKTRSASIFKRVISIISAALLILVLTNNLHHQVFVFDFSDPSWSGDYKYAWGYWVVFGWITMIILSIIGILFVTARKQLRSALVVVAILGCTAGVYALMYAFYVSVARPSNMSLTFSILLLVTLEMCFRFGILPSCSCYRDVFKKLPLDIKIFSKNYEVDRMTDQATPLGFSAERLLESITEEDGIRKFEATSGRDVLFKKHFLKGGIVLITHDMSTINRQWESLLSKRDLLKRKNELVKQDYIIRERLYRLQTEKELLEKIERVLLHDIESISKIFKNLSSLEKEAGEDERIRGLLEIKIRIAYCKRKVALALLNEGGLTITVQGLNMIMDEACADLRSIGMRCAVFIEVDRDLPLKVMHDLYDSFHTFVLFALSCENPVFMVSVSEKNTVATSDKQHIGIGDKNIVMHVFLESTDTENLLTVPSLSLMKHALRESASDCMLNVSEGILELTVVIPGKAL